MKKALKIILRCLSGVIIFLIMLPIFASILLQIPVIQNFVVGKATEILSEISGTKVEIKHVALDFFTSARFEGVYIEDYDRDTMLYSKSINVDIRGINFMNGRITLGDVKLDSTQVHFAKDSTGLLNITRFANTLTPEEKNPSPPNFRLTAGGIKITDLWFTMADYEVEETKGKINFKDLDLKAPVIDMDDISVVNYNVWLTINNITIKEKSGLEINDFKTVTAGVDSSGMFLSEVSFKSAQSSIKLDSLNLVSANNTWMDWTDFENNMIIATAITDSKLSTNTLKQLAGIEFPKPQIIDIEKATLRGKVGDMKGELSGIGFADNTLYANYEITGLPDIDNTFFDIDITDIQSSGKGINSAIDAFNTQELGVNDRKILHNFGDINVGVDFEGGVKQFKALIDIHSSTSGLITASCDMHQSKAGKMLFSGDINTNNFNVGRAVDVKKLGTATFGGNYNVNIQKDSSLVFDAQIDVKDILYGTYKYQNITIDGEFSAGMFSGLISAKDPNLDMDIVGLFDYSDSLPKYTLSTDLREVDLAAIKVNKRDSISKLSAKFDAEGSGTTLDDFNGQGTIDKILYINHTDTVRTAAISLHAIAEPTFREIEISSHFMDLKLRGRNSFNEIFAYFSKSLERFMPSFPEVSTIVDDKSSNKKNEGVNKKEAAFPFNDGYYLFSAKVKEANNVSSIFYPSLKIANGTSVNFFFNPYLDQFTLKAHSDYITSNDFYVDSLNIDSRNIADSLSLYTTAKVLAVGDLFFPNFAVLGGICNNVITLGAQYRTKTNHSSALINTTTHFDRLEDGTAQMQIDLHPTAITYDSMQWNISPTKILFDSTKLEIQHLTISSKDQKLDINGRIGKKDTDTLKVNLLKADLSPLNYFVGGMGYDVKGIADGWVDVISLTKNPRIFSTVTLSDIDVSNHKIGDVEILSAMNPKEREINFSVGRPNSQLRPIIGEYSVPDSALKIDINLPEVPLSLLDPLLSGVISQSKGTASTNLTMTASSDDMSLDGEINFDVFSTVIDFTQVRYTVKNGKLAVKNNCFYMDKTDFTDSEKGTGKIAMNITSEKFANLKYDVDLSFTDLMALNTTNKDNDSFFGKAYGTGRVEINGSQSKTTMNIVAQSALNSVVTMPMSGASNIEEAEFIRFVKPKKEKNKKENIYKRYKRNTLERKKKESSTEIDMNLDITVLPNTLAQIELDPKVGDIIKGRGEGKILMHINPTLDIFEMTGPVRLTEGDYLFTLQTIINKKFIVNPGGLLTWTGDPTNPDVDITAVYKLKTSLAPLTGDVGDNSKANIDCGINLTGLMLTPNVEFTITAPSADAEIQNALRNTLNTDEALSMQFLSLMLANSFMPDMGTASIGTMGSNMAEVTGIEFLSNQLSNLISSEKLDIRIGYKPMSETNSDEFSAGVGTDLIENVLSLEVDGNYNAQNNSALNTENPFSVDAYLTWNINESGTLKLKGFTRTIDRFDETQGMQESGVGVYFTQDFNNFKDLQQRLQKSFKTDSINKAQKKAKRLEKKRKREEQRELKAKEREAKKQERKKNKNNNEATKPDSEQEQ